MRFFPIQRCLTFQHWFERTQLFESQKLFAQYLSSYNNEPKALFARDTFANVSSTSPRCRLIFWLKVRQLTATETAIISTRCWKKFVRASRLRTSSIIWRLGGWNSSWYDLPLAGWINRPVIRLTSKLSLMENSTTAFNSVSRFSNKWSNWNRNRVSFDTAWKSLKSRY